MRSAVEAAGEVVVAQDILQLDGLCERMDTEAFLPLAADDLSNAIFRRVVEFGRIVDDATGMLVEKGVVSAKGGRATGGNGYYGRYFLLNGVGVFLICDVRKWMKYAATPLWLSVYGTKWRASEPGAAHRALEAFGISRAGRVFKSGDGFPTIALPVSPGVERDAVLAQVVEQVAEIGNVVASLGVGTPEEAPVDEQSA